MKDVLKIFIKTTGGVFWRLLLIAGLIISFIPLVLFYVFSSLNQLKNKK